MDQALGPRRMSLGLLEALPWPQPFTMPVFLQALGQHRGRPIRVLRASLRTLPCGLVMRTNDVDYVVVARSPSPVHARHILLHELGHLLLEHPSAEAAALTNPRVLSDPDAERQAELFAILARLWIEHRQASPREPPQSWEEQQLRATFGAHVDDCG